MLALAARFYGWSHADLMAMTTRQISGYLHHIPALSAQEQIEAYETQRLFHLKPNDRRRGIADLFRRADGKPAPTLAETKAAQQAEFDAGWARLRGRLGSTPARGLRAGERILIPAEA